MKPRHIALLLAILVGAIAESLAQASEDSAIYKKIASLDAAYFTAYNTCDLDTQARLLDDQLEFYHDQGGLSTSKAEILEALRVNICGKVTRSLVEGSLEVHEINGFGAVALGLHQFHNREEPGAESKPSRFVTVWKQNGEAWTMYRIISLH